MIIYFFSCIFMAVLKNPRLVKKIGKVQSAKVLKEVSSCLSDLLWIDV